MSETVKTNRIRILDLEFEPFLSKEQISSTVDKLGKQITQDYLGKKPIFIAILNGSYVFMADLLRACKLECEMTFVKLSSYQGLESSGVVATQIGLSLDIRGRDIIIVEDIIDTGTTIHHFLQQIKKFEPASVKLATLLFKPKALQHPLKIDYTGFEIPNQFVVGYGLDYNEAGRNLPAIYQLVSE